MGFTNYYSMYVEMYAEVVAILQDKLKVPRELGKKGAGISCISMNRRYRPFKR